jgi:adenylate cyclase class IV
MQSGKLADREVEEKFAISESEANDMPERLARLGFVQDGIEPILQEDIYLPAPANTASRLRKETIAGETRLIYTYKEPGKGANRHSTRSEINAPLSPDMYEALLRYGTALAAGVELIRVHKTRRTYELSLNSQCCGELIILASIDVLPGLRLDGELSYFLEIECVQPGTATEEQIGAVLAELRSCAQQLIGDRPAEKKGYRKMATEVAAARQAQALTASP